nr:hypothetical protein [Tanacetum cinerariifolium]
MLLLLLKSGRREVYIGQNRVLPMVARRDKRIEARELEIKNLEALLETETNMKRATEDKSDGLIKELENMRALFLDLQVSHGQLSQQVASLKEWVIGHGLRLAMMKCAESLEMRQAFADVVSVGVAKGMSEGLKHGVEHGQARLTKYGMLSTDSVDTPMVDKSKLDKNLQGKPVDPTHYRGMIGLWYSKDSSNTLTAYADADHTGCQDTRQSTSGSAQLLVDKLDKENQEKDKIGLKPDKNGKRGEVEKSQKQLQLKEEEKPKKTKKEWPKTNTRIKSY